VRNLAAWFVLGQRGFLTVDSWFRMGPDIYNWMRESKEDEEPMGAFDADRGVGPICIMHDGINI
jgi:hypothetical protein